MAAIRALGTLAENVHLGDEQLSQIVGSITGNIEGEQRWVKSTAIRTLRDLGDSAKPALAVLRAMEANDPERRVRRAAKEAIKKITAAEPAKLQLTELREEMFSAEVNQAFLERVADETVGRIYRPEQLGELFEDLAYSQEGSTVREYRELWDMPVLFLLLLSLLVSEWALRRKWGLA